MLAIQCNLVELDGLKSDSVDGAICLFSTLGMIQGRDNRQQFLTHVRRILKPGGAFVVHAHNLWFQVRHPGGKSWLARSVVKTMLGKQELGDRYSNYRGIRNMFIHSYRKRELRQELRRCGFHNQSWYGLRPDSTEIIPSPGWFETFQLVGWTVACD